MKVAFIGKGGSGKSSVSWLAARLLAERGRDVFAIDADHNMDLASLLGVTVSSDTPTFHRAHEAFRTAVGQKPDDAWADIVLDGRPKPSFSLEPKDSLTQEISLPVPGQDRITAAVVGLGAEDVLFSGKCAHGHSAPLKFYLPFLDTGENADVVIDGVAGADMMNFGLFLGCDAVVVVVEPHPNSMRVLEQVAGIADRTSLPLYVVINKVLGVSEHLDALERAWSDHIVGRIPADRGLMSYVLEELASDTRAQGEEMLDELSRRTRDSGDAVARMEAFERARAEAA